MKNSKKNMSVLFKSIVLSIILLGFIGCKENDEICYSCNSEINDWVKANKEEIINYDRAKISEFSHSYQKAILGAIPADKKKLLWAEKVNHIINLDLPIEEKQYLQWYKEIFEKIDYSYTTPKEVEKVMYERTIEGMKKFGWSKDFVYQTFFVIGDVDLQNVTTRSVIKPVGDDEVDCDCLYDIGCGLMHGECNKNVDCSSSSDDDCGVLGNSDCDGKCL